MILTLFLVQILWLHDFGCYVHSLAFDAMHRSYLMSNEFSLVGYFCVL
jgi:hypothetical protein